MWTSRSCKTLMDKGLYIFGTATLTESVGVSVPTAFSNRVQRLFPQSLVPAVNHARDSKGTKFPISFGDVDATHRFAFIVPANYQLTNRGKFLAWIIPNDSIYSRGIVTRFWLVATMRTAIARPTQEFTRSCCNIFAFALSLFFHATLICTCIWYTF